LRSFTGFLFGYTTAWFGYPLVEETMRETRNLMRRKLERYRRLGTPAVKPATSLE
jgi:hypothetical protein